MFVFAELQLKIGFWWPQVEIATTPLALVATSLYHKRGTISENTASVLTLP